MAITRPIVYVYQEYATVTTAPETPDLNCLYSGPCYHIQDYPTDSDDIDVGAFVKSPYTDADSPCGTDGSSLGRPDPGSDFLVLSDPPNNATGAILDSSSVEIVFDDTYIEIAASTDGVVTATDSNEFTSVLGDFVNDNVQPGDRVVMSKASPDNTAANTIVKTVSSVTDANTLALTSDFLAADVAKIGSSAVLYRIEHTLDDQVIGSAYYSVSGNEITIKTGATGLLVAYGSYSYPVNFADSMYVGYRSLRVDITDILTLDDSDAIETNIGRIDERNPLAVAAYVGFTNTGTRLQVIGVDTDDLIGQTSVRDTISTREDVYAIVPVTDGLSGATWVTVLAMWKAHCEAFADPAKSKYRVCIGSYDILPTEKSSAPASLVGWTLQDPVNTTLYDVMVDPAATADFVGAEIDSTHLLDLMHGATMKTVAANSHIFTDTYAAKELLGVIGKKRLRTTAADKFSASASAESNGYMVRNSYLKDEGGSGYTEDVDAITWADNGSAKARIGKTGGFSNATVGDVAKVSGGATGGNNGGWLVIAVNADYIDVELAYSADANSGQPGFACQVYRCVTGSYVGDADITGGNTFNDQASGSSFANALVGDIVLCWDSATSANKGMWVITNKTDDDNVVVGTPATLTNDATNATVVSLFRIPYKAISANASLTARLRLTRLRDNTASFTTTVEIGENIQIPYPEDTDPLKFDTTTTSWPILTIVSDQTLDADLEELEELAPELFIAGYDGDMPYRISIDLDRTAQVTELNTITNGLKSSRCVMAWPNECYVSSVTNAKTGVQNRLHGQYLACTIGGMIAGLPPHQGFTFIGIGGIQQLFNSNTYFTDDHIDDLSEGGWYVFLQDSETSTPYSAHEVTTDTDAYETGELMAVKDFDYVAMFYKAIMQQFLGRYNISSETLEFLGDAFDDGTQALLHQEYPNIGTPILDADVTELTQLADERDRVEIYATVEIPSVLNKIGLHLRA